ncbi:MAG: hypothetical protein WA126_07600 [Thermodesulfovibrionales bacterium]
MKKEKNLARSPRTRGTGLSRDGPGKAPAGKYGHPPKIGHLSTDKDRYQLL